MKRAIIGFHRDPRDDWVADLDCAHAQHVRHKPPFQNRSWVVTEDGRNGMLGTELDCVLCDRMEWPADAHPYRTLEFDDATLPVGLVRDHATARGVWGRIHVSLGVLDYHVGAPINRTLRLAGDSVGIVVPQVRHRIEPKGRVRLRIEFARRTRVSSSGSAKE